MFDTKFFSIGEIYIDLAYFIDTLVLDVSERVLYEFAHFAIASPFFDSVQHFLVFYSFSTIISLDFLLEIFQVFSKQLKREIPIKKLLLEYFLTKNAQPTYSVCFDK